MGPILKVSIVLTFFFSVQSHCRSRFRAELNELEENEAPLQVFSKTKERYLAQNKTKKQQKKIIEDKVQVKMSGKEKAQVQGEDKQSPYRLESDFLRKPKIKKLRMRSR